MGLSTPNLLYNEVDDTGGTSGVTSGTLSPTSGALLICIMWRVGGADRSPNTPTSGWTDTGWTELTTHTRSGEVELAAFWTEHVSGTGTLTAGWDGAGNDAGACLIEITGQDASTPVAQHKFASQASGTSASVTLDSSPASDSVVIASIVNAGGASVTPGSGFTELLDNSTGSNMVCQAQYDATSPGTTADWSGLNSSNSVSISIEIAAEAVSSRRIFIIS